MLRIAFIIQACFFLIACGTAPVVTNDRAGTLPAPITNNAVAAIEQDDGWAIFSFNGLGKGKGWQQVSNVAFRVDPDSGKAETLAPVPGIGRLASTAAVAGGDIYIFGGYTVAEDGTEKSLAEVWKFDPFNEIFTRQADMPTAVDDSVALTYRDRYIYLLGGWHDQGNVRNVQVYDTRDQRWMQATPFPGTPVFGHAGAIYGRSLLLVDGVAVTGQVEGRRQFGAIAQFWTGTIDADNPARIDWQQLPDHPGQPLYRAGATVDRNDRRLILAGGSNNPYNYNGIGYNGAPSQPAQEIMSYDFDSGRWRVLGLLETGVMDLRGLVKVTDDYFLVGGMTRDQQVSDGIFRFRLPAND